MKKHLLIAAFAFFLIGGSQMSFAQTKLENQKVAIENADSSVKKNAQKVINLLEREAKLDADQKTKVYDIFVAVDKKLKAIDTIEDAAEKKQKQTKMQAYINQKLQQVLTQEQYKLYLTKTATAY